MPSSALAGPVVSSSASVVSDRVYSVIREEVHDAGTIDGADGMVELQDFSTTIGNSSQKNVSQKLYADSGKTAPIPSVQLPFWKDAYIVLASPPLNRTTLASERLGVKIISRNGKNTTTTLTFVSENVQELSAPGDEIADTRNWAARKMIELCGDLQNKELGRLVKGGDPKHCPIGVVGSWEVWKLFTDCVCLPNARPPRKFSATVGTR